jgi:metal-responsive CopG/Arc/MetJ family transcriptional regulator
MLCGLNQSIREDHMTKDAKPTPQHRQLTGVRLPPELLDRLEVFCQAQKLKPSRTRVLEISIRKFLEREEDPQAMLLPERAPVSCVVASQ